MRAFPGCFRIRSGRFGGQTAGGHPKASPRRRQPLFAVLALRELESACRVCTLWYAVTVPMVCFSEILRGSSVGVSSTVLRPKTSAPFARGTSKRMWKWFKELKGCAEAQTSTSKFWFQALWHGTQNAHKREHTKQARTNAKSKNCTPFLNNTQKDIKTDGFQNSQFWCTSYFDTCLGVSGVLLGCALVAQCSATPATVAATPPCSATPCQTPKFRCDTSRHGGAGEVRHQNV